MRCTSKSLEQDIEERASLLPEVKTEAEVIDMEDRRLEVPGKCKNICKEYCGKRECEAKRVQMTTVQTG